MTPREQWIEALRSGKYKQGKERLRDGDQFCCLGVACDLEDSSFWIEDFDSNDDDDDGGFNWGGAYTTLPCSMMDKLNLTPFECNALAAANDKGKSFKEIADMIEQMP